jgi:hypothetical protein
MPFAEIFAERFEAQAQVVLTEAQSAGQSVLDELDRERLAYRRQLQAQSALRFRLGQTLRAAASQLNRLARRVSP